MALKFTDISVPAGTTAEFAFLVSILKSEYSITVFYENANNIVFSCPAISDKVIKFYLQYGEDNLYVYLGDSWTSETTITNQIAISGTRLRMGTYFRIFTGPNLFIINQYGILGSAAGVWHFVALGKLNNNEFIAICLRAGAQVLYNSTAGIYYNRMLLFDGNIKNNKIKLYSQPLIFIGVDTNISETASNEIITIPELKNVSYVAGSDGCFYSDYYFSNTFSSCPTSIVFLYV